MKFLSIILLNLFFLFNSKYENSQRCVAITNPSNKETCHDVQSDFSEFKKRIACCYVEYNTDDEGDVKRCVPIYKTINGLHMYEEQLENLGANSIDIDCSSQKIIISFLMIVISCLALY